MKGGQDREEGELEPDVPAFVAGVAILSQVGGADPPLRLEQHAEALEVGVPDGDIDVLGLARHTASVEVDRPRRASSRCPAP
jgi:dihydroorotase-like cyclic amidohydrolase